MVRYKHREVEINTLQVVYLPFSPRMLINTWFTMVFKHPSVRFFVLIKEDKTYRSHPSLDLHSNTPYSLCKWKNRVPVEIAAITWVWDWTHSLRPSPTIIFQWTTPSHNDSPHLPFSLNDFKSFWLSFQSPFHLSLALLVCYRCLALYLVLDVLYHPFRAILPNSSTR